MYYYNPFATRRKKRISTWPCSNARRNWIFHSWKLYFCSFFEEGCIFWANFENLHLWQVFPKWRIFWQFSFQKHQKQCNWCVFHIKPNFHNISPNFGKFPEKKQFFWKFGSHLGSSTRNCEKTLFFNSSLISFIAFNNPCGVNLLHIFCRQKKIRTQKSSLFWRYLRKKSSPGIRVTDKERVKDV